ncbi:MAG: hypothetical protein NDI62_00360 [Burkholderiales bacterium]|nr:hypothetical protein [Burkholderiales bacterium]
MVTDQKVPVLKTAQETSSIINSLFSNIQKEKGINVDVNSRMVGDISVDNVILDGIVVATILSDKGLKAKKELSTFSEFVQLIKELKEVGNFQYPKIVNIFVLKDIRDDYVILAIREGTEIPSFVRKLL